MHPLLIPSSWLLEGRYFPTGREPQRVTGVTEVHPWEEYPEMLEVGGEVRDADDPRARPVRSTYHLDLSGPNTLRFRMDSLPLGTVLTGEGRFDDQVLVLHYCSPDRRIHGVESFAACGEGELRATGVVLADGAPVTAWIAHLERVERPPQRRD